MLFDKKTYKEDMYKIMFDPNLIQIYSLNKLKEALDDKPIDITDPNNPFMFLLEQSSAMTAASMMELKESLRGIYPTLATNKKELFNHINATEINDILASPSIGNFNIFLNKDDIKRYIPKIKNYYELLIPKYSYITIQNTKFTLLNDIVVRLYENDTIFAKQLYNELSIAYLDNEIVDVEFVKDRHGIEWISLNLDIKQLERNFYKDNLLVSQAYKKTLAHDDMLYFTRLHSLNPKINKEIELDVVFSNFIYNPHKTTAILRPLEEEFEIEIPSIYVLNHMLSSYLKIEYFTTKGPLNLHLSNFQTEDFIFTVADDENNDKRSLHVKDIRTFVNSNSSTYGGKKEKTFEELKELIINYATGDNNLPITYAEIEEIIKRKKFIFRYIADTILTREILLSKKIGLLNYPLYTNIDLFEITTSLDLDKTNIKKLRHKRGQYFIIEPYQIFEYSNGFIKPISDLEAEKLKTLPYENPLKYNEKKYFFNPYK